MVGWLPAQLQQHPLGYLICLGFTNLRWHRELTKLGQFQTSLVGHGGVLLRLGSRGCGLAAVGPPGHPQPPRRAPRCCAVLKHRHLHAPVPALPPPPPHLYHALLPCFSNIVALYLSSRPLRLFTRPLGRLRCIVSAGAVLSAISGSQFIGRKLRTGPCHRKLP